ncbi:UTP--glucose-1-phosphate uridylyltransferase [Propionibacterium australiense]|uniref:UTP--glucose-1-phosphate uridylyltransferase n=1 Tax=Propionibacterium australiense TaxID=119981 RepID=A0A383S764_9ACTN|nr:UTP--glucose-1-phosphate uridylyltransferase [Propionibacterium australiense]RLP09769.1 UTP--glucose-1-phosphate uridylyltransferase [Propionibacterium australiense]RLP10182.1 UTP--glucose-1-phosphate uridylyltransferase [Propionibacterium australiense]SYZ33244.1 UTP-glucose-1-phosphate uridylyltransferase [Propionibacterium australiense]VEH89262.1 UTP--glucose-1-phosphate uridylyltransferase [Propionibacterium australiense]
MSAQGLARAAERMAQAGLPRLAIDVFSDYYHQLEQGRTGLIGEDTITPITRVDDLADAEFSAEEQARALSRTVFIRLNGGLGTSMGMDRAKSLLPVRDGLSFLDIIVRQLQAVRAGTGVQAPLILMNSFRTRDDSLELLSGYPRLNPDGIPADFCQHREPKLLVDSLEPVDWPADPELEWCPPGHGDIYVALQTTGILDALIAGGYRYANTANADNLGAAPDGRLAAWFAASGAPYSPEVCLRTPADRKGGHLAIRTSDGRMILRDTAQTPEADMRWFTDEHRHRFFHTNNLWFDLVALRDALAARGGLPGLPLIRNRKHVDPSDPASPEVFQIESALGAIVEVFDGARPVLVPRERFLPVKTTDDLALVRSDVYELGADYRLRRRTESTPLVRLDPQHYKLIADFEARFPSGVPSLREATSLTVQGDWTFGAGVVARGDVVLGPTTRPMRVEDGARL